MLETIKNAIHQEVNELFAIAAMDELMRDTKACRTKLNQIAQIAEMLGIDMEITEIQISLKATPE